MATLTWGDGSGVARQRRHAQLVGRPGFRGDIEGLRAVAVTLVLLWHAGLAFVPGGFVGVDVFFVISGFLITGMIVSELKNTGRLSLVGFYSRRAKRILPAAGFVLLSTLLLTVLFLPRIRWPDTSWDVVASGFYVVNWRLAERSVDYLSADAAPSVVQHFWSLSVEEQFYFVWPLLLLLVSWPRLRARRTRDIEKPLLLGLVLIVVPSFIWSVYLSDADPGRAYFVTPTRMWELALGGGLAIALGRLSRIPTMLAVVAGWAGLAAILGSAVLLSEAHSFPGTAALLPTLGAAAIVASGTAAGRVGPAALLGSRPLRTVGALSYSLYLWHWPLLVVAEARFGQLGPAWSLVVVGFSALPAWLTYRFVESPFRLSATLTHIPARALQLGALCTAAPVVAGVVFHGFIPLPADPGSSLLAIDSPGVLAGEPRSAAGGPLGAAVLSARPRNDPKGTPVDRVSSIFPDPMVVRKDLPALYKDGCHQEESGSAATPCSFGAADSAFTVAVIGDSHAAQWTPALEAIAPLRKWRILTYTKSSCPLANVQVPASGSERPYDSCTDWNANVLKAVTRGRRPNLVITSSSNYLVLSDGRLLSPSASANSLVTGFRATWSILTAAGIPVVVLRDTPNVGIDMADCISAHGKELTKCAVARERSLSGAGPIQIEAAAGMKKVHVIDLDDAICPTDKCAAVIGGVIVYRDSNHLTATYAQSLAPRLNTALSEALA
jgi:peptidoglycan/LPS O-acetylase OafA/YrhL